MLCAPPDTLAILKWKGREEGQGSEKREDRGGFMGLAWAITSQNSGKKF